MKARILIDYVPTGEIASIRGHVLPVTHTWSHAVEVAWNGRRLWFTKREAEILPEPAAEAQAQPLAA